MTLATANLERKKTSECARPRAQQLQNTDAFQMSSSHGSVRIAAPGPLRPPQARSGTKVSACARRIRSVLKATALRVFATLLLTAACTLSAADQSSDARKKYAEAQADYSKQQQNPDVAWKFGRACFDVGEVATNSAERALIAQQGIAACRAAVAAAPKSAGAHYYLAMNQGQLARTKSLGALKLVDEMEREFTTASKLDEKFDHAGPDRNLGLLYRDAPSIGSIGSRSKARQHLQRAVELEPDYPDNRLEFIEALIHWHDTAAARREFKTLEEHWPASKAAYSGPAWQASWEDWEARRQKYKKKLG